MTRFLKAVGLVTALALWGAAGPAAAADELLSGNPFDLEFREIAPGVVTATRAPYWRTPVVGTAAIIIGERDVMLFDSGGSNRGARQIMAKVRQLTDKPVRYIVLSHWHDDHTRGLNVLKQALPEARIIAHPYTRDYIAGPMLERFKLYPERWVNIVARLRKELDSGVTEATGEPVSAGNKLIYRQLMADREPLMEEFSAINSAVPDVGVAGGMEIDLGGRRVRLDYLGLANTPGDLVAWLPDEEILLAGDVINHPIPFGYPRAPRELVKALEALKTYDFDIMVPGHGDAQRDTAFIDKVIGLLNYVNDQVDAGIAQGRTEEEIERDFDWRNYVAEFTGGDPIAEAEFADWFQSPVVANSYNEIVPQEEGS